MRTALPLCTSIALAACATVPAGPAPTGMPVALGQPVRVGSLLVTPEKVTEDSRCADGGVQCVWAGRVVLSARIDGGAGHETTPLILGTARATHGTAVTLVSVTPPKRAGSKIPERDYRFTFAGGR